MALDSRPGIAAMLAHLYPSEEEEKPLVEVKQEKEKVIAMPEEEQKPLME